MPKICIKVAGNSPVGGGIDAVGGYFIFDDRRALNVEIFLGRHTHRCIGREHLDAVVTGTDAEFILGTYHSETLDSADFGFLDFEIAREHSSELGKEDFLSCCHIGSTAYYLDRLRSTVIYGSHVEMVRVRMGLAGEHLGNDHIFKAALYDLRFLNRVNFYSY